MRDGLLKAVLFSLMNHEATFGFTKAQDGDYQITVVKSN